MKVELVLYLDEEHKSIGTFELDAMNYELNHSFLILYFSGGEVWLLPIARVHNAYFWPEGVEPSKAPDTHQYKKKTKKEVKMGNEIGEFWWKKELRIFQVRCGKLEWTIGARDRVEVRNALVDLMVKQANKICLSDLSAKITLKTAGEEYPQLRLNDVVEEVAALAGPEEEEADE